MADDSIRGRFVWHELMTTDTEAAASFYAKVVGWKIEAWQRDSSYTLFNTKDGGMAGLMLIPEDAKAMGAPPSWLCYIGTPDVDDTTSHAGSMGAKVLREPGDIPEVGRFSVLQDPQGAVFALFTPRGDGSRPEGSPLGDFSWHELITSDWPAAFEFYEALFGWEKTESMDMGPMGVYQMYGWPGKTLGGMFNKPPEMPAPPHWLPYVKVPDVKKAAQTVEKLGGRILNGPMEVPGGDWIVQIMDPQGAVFALHSAKPAEPKEARPAAKAPEKEPAASQRAPRRPAGAQPAAGKATRKTVSRKPAAEKPAAKKSAAKKPAAKKPSARKPAAKKPAVRKAATRKAKAGKAAPARSAARKPGAKKSKATNAPARKPAARKAAARTIKKAKASKSARGTKGARRGKATARSTARKSTGPGKRL